MTEKYTIKDVTDDLGFLLTLTKMFGTDDQGFWIDLLTKERFAYSLGAGEAKREIVNFQDPMPSGDYYFFNPYSEGFGKKTPASELFYRLCRAALNVNLSKAVLYVASEALHNKQAVEAKVEYRNSHVVTRMSSVRIDRKSTLYDVVDEKMIDEFKLLFERMKEECIFVPYMKSQRRSIVTCDALQDAEWDEKFGKDIRKKTLSAFKATLMGVLGILTPDDLDSFSVSYDPNWNSSPRIHTTMSVYLNLYSKFNDVLAHAFGSDGVPLPSNEVDLGQLGEVIERMPLAYPIAKHMVQSAIKITPTSTTTADTSSIRLPNDTGAARTGATSRVPPPLIVDDSGRRIIQPNGQPLGGGFSTSRLPPQIISDGPADPFAPYSRPAPMTNFGGGGFGSGGFGGGQNFGGFGGGFGGNRGFDFTPSSAFGSPLGQRSFFNR